MSTLIGRVSIENMREAGLMVDGDAGRVSPQKAAEWLAETVQRDR